MNIRQLSLSAILCFSFACAWADVPVRIVTEPEAGCVTIAGATVADKAYVLYDDSEAEVVETAISLFLGDAKSVTSKTFVKRATPDVDKCAIIVGTIGQSKYID
ncbi:MAG: hypothetical protein HUK03_09380, partial [Bacteroidaceae bacterium]|nr:hypothetical protein [Bacteroidaceae bacterium]